MTDERRRERDLILAPNEHAFILDETKGNIINYVGPHKTSLANTDQPVVFNSTTKRFNRCTLEQAISPFAIAPEGWYLMLKNPAEGGKYPKTGTANTLLDLDIGRKINIPGPISFARWPGQMIRVIKGHNLRSNQYLVVRVYDEEAATKNWTKAVIKPQTSPAENGEAVEDTEQSLAETGEVKPDSTEAPDLTMGKLLVIKGTDVSFYIPPTGIEVVSDPNQHYVRSAVTLERLEYCILLDEDGHKRYIKGPAVVFPKPTETIVRKNKVRKFKAIELDENSGLYIKVIAPYEENGQQYKMGDELFLTGKEQMIYFPRSEHAIIRYGEQDVYHAAAIPTGEAFYVLDRLTGQIILEKGPSMFLPDPRKKVIVRRILTQKQVNLWFPGNEEALAYNKRLMTIARQEKGENFIEERQAKKLLKATTVEELLDDTSNVASKEFVGDEFTRSFAFPRTVTLDTKYEGAVAVNIWTGYAVLVVSKTGERKVIVGPQTYLLEYDETLEPVELSTGTPKTDKKLLQTVYLRALHNKISDIVEAETKDFCHVRVNVSYRVNFDGDPNQWFNVENYVKFLCDHMRSILRHAIKQQGIEEFYAKAITIVRDTILGSPNKDGNRSGRIFEENGMRIYDTEILDVYIEDTTISNLLIQAQHNTIQQVLELATEKKNQEVIQQKETIKQNLAKAKAKTQKIILDLQVEETQKRLTLDLTKIRAEDEAKQKQLEAKLTEQEPLDKINEAELARQKAKHDLEIALAQQQLEQQLETLKAEVQAIVDKSEAVSPQLVAALQAFSDKALAEKMAESMAPLAILGGKSVADVFSQLLQGTVLENVLTATNKTSP